MADAANHWALDDAALWAMVGSSPGGLSGAEGSRRRAAGPRGVGDRRVGDARLLIRQFRSPIIMLLVVAAMLSTALGERTDAAIIVGIVVLSGLLGFMQERGAVRAVEALLLAVRVHADVLRDGTEAEILLDDVVCGDVVVLRAGDVVPGDGRVVWSNQLLLDESVLTGEAYPRRKEPGLVDATAPLADRWNCVHLGTHVASGEGLAVMVHTGVETEFGRVAEHVARAHVPTAFERGVTAFGFLLMQATAVLVAGVFVVNVVMSRPVVESFLFSLALAVGLTPQMLPAIVTLSMSRGASAMSDKRVIVKRLDAIEDVGSLDVLCTDKTGTITTGTVALTGSLDPDGNDSSRVRRLARWNSTFQSGFDNPIDHAILRDPATLQDPGIPVDDVRLIGEIPFDFIRRRLSVVVDTGDGILLVTKGAVASVKSCCGQVRTASGVRPIEDVSVDLQSRFEALSAEGVRVLAVATRECAESWPLDARIETGMVFEGFLCFDDPLKEGVGAAIARLGALGVSVRIISGDNRHVAAHIARSIGVSEENMLTGEMISTMSDAALTEAVERASLFAETSPIDKERVIRAFSTRGHTVGYLGDGINDAPALRLADVGVSVDSAVDVAKQAADLVLMDKSLDVLAAGVEQGRRVFVNTLKYVHVTTSANFGNMLSLAAASMFLPFLPLVPTQILLLNFLSDVPGMTIATDRVDPEQVALPHKWDIGEVRRFMVLFGVASTVFDLLTFAVLRLGFGADATLLRSGWFVESTLTELAAMLVLRTQRPGFRSRPSRALVVSSSIVAVTTLVLPWSPLAGRLGLTGIPAGLLPSLLGLTVAYVLVTESLKRIAGES